MRVTRNGRGGVTEHDPIVPRELADGANVSGRAEHNHFWYLPPSRVNGIAGVRFNRCRKFETVIPEHLRSARLHHKLSALFDLVDVPFSSLLPRRVWLGLTQLAVGLIQLPSKVVGELFFGVVDNHRRWYAITME